MAEKKTCDLPNSSVPSNIGIDEKKRVEILKQRGYSQFKSLDSGGQGSIYKTVKNNITYACKVVHIENPNDTALDVDLWRELAILKNLRHPNCIRVVDLFRTKNKVYMVMDFMSNGTIGSHVRKNGPLCEWKVKNWFCPIARAIRFLHIHKIAHRDLKLDNILLDAHFNPILTDFGFSRFVSIDRKTGVTQKSDTFCGTPTYYPPEIVMKMLYDPYKVDIWCLGICLFIMLNKDYPFDKSNKKLMYENQMKRMYAFQSSVNSKISDDVKNLVKILLEPNPNQRPNIDQVCNHFWFPIDSRV